MDIRSNSAWAPVVALAIIYAYIVLVLGTCAYAVFWRGFSGWWFLLAVVLASVKSTSRD